MQVVLTAWKYIKPAHLWENSILDAITVRQIILLEIAMLQICCDKISPTLHARRCLGYNLPKC